MVLLSARVAAAGALLAVLTLGTVLAPARAQAEAATNPTGPTRLAFVPPEVDDEPDARAESAPDPEAETPEPPPESSAEPVGGSAVDPDHFPSDPRIVEANSLLDDKSRWDDALALYREVLADDPDHVEARLWAARVLSWQQQHEASLEEYRTLARGPAPPPVVWVERAEVLSWAGRYEDAEAAFEAILAEDPENARAAVGLARVYLWSGREREADEAYERALELDDDPEVRQERGSLRAQMGSQGQGDSSFFSDSDDFSLTRVGANGSMDIDLATRLLVGTAFTRAHAGTRDPALAVQGMPDTDRSIDGLIGLERRFTQGLKGRIQAGGRWWDESQSRFLATGGLEYTWSDMTVVGLDADYGDILERTHSLDAVLAGIDAVTARGWLWKGLTTSTDAYGYVEGSYLTDGNDRIAFGGSTGWRPDPDFDFRINLFVDAVTFGREDLLYYSPQMDVAGGAGVSGLLPLYRSLAAEYDFQIGGGYADEGGISGAGPVYGVQAGLVWKPEGWWIRATGSYARSQRVTAYRSSGALLTIGRGF